MAAQKTGDGLDQFIFRIGGGKFLFGSGEEDAAQHIALGQDGGGAGYPVAVVALDDRLGIVALLILLDPSPFHDLHHGLGEGPVGQLPLARAGHRQTGVPVGDDGHTAGGFIEGVAHLPYKIPKTAHEGIFFENDPAVTVRINLQGVALGGNRERFRPVWSGNSDGFFPAVP